MRLNALRHLAVLALSLLALPAYAGEITDVTGRKVELDLPVKRVIVGEARQIHVIAALKGDQTFDTIVGWRDDLLKKDPDSYAAYVERFPQIEKLPRFGYVPQGDFSLETAITLSPDVITLNLEAEKSAKESGFEEKAAAAGIKIVYLDFRIDPEKNSEASIEILGKMFGAQERAKEFIAYRRAEIARVTDRLASVKDLKRPGVFIERAPGISGEDNCCRTFGRSISARWSISLAAIILPTASSRRRSAISIPSSSSLPIRIMSSSPAQTGRLNPTSTSSFPLDAEPTWLFPGKDWQT